MEQTKPKHIVCFALPAWEAEYSRSTVELMKCLSTDNLVLYVDYAYTISDCIKGVFGKKKFDWKRLLGIKKRLRRASGSEDTGLYILSLPPVFPAFSISSYRWFKIACKFNAAFTCFYINRAIKKLGMKDIIGFNSFQPFLGQYWNIKNLTFLVYYIYDDFTNVPWFKGFAAIEERKFIRQADLVVVSSDELKKRKQQNDTPTEVVYNGVHYDAFFSQINNTSYNPQENIIGYTGTIDSRMDIDLLEPVIQEMADIRFLFIGKIFDQNIGNRLSKYQNVTFHPPVPAEAIPGLQRQIHAGIIPYVCNELTAAIYPLKANEYLAMGLPVIMTPFASIGEADDVVYIAKDAKSFKQCIEIALEENDEALKQRRLSIAKKADWQTRSKQLVDLIEKHQAIRSGITVLQ